MRIALLGDIALFGCNTAADGTYRSRMAAVKEVLDCCDYVVGNLETPLTDATKSIGGKSAYIKGLPENAEILQWLGVTHVSLANNHMFDYRAQGLDDTINTLDAYGIHWYGANGKSEYIENVDGRVSLRGYCCYSTNGKGMSDKAPCVDVLDPLVVETDLNDDRKEGRFPILSMHWGQEHVHYPNYDHVMLARRLAHSRQLVIHGHHPHVLQGLEEPEGSLIAYSLGNFCFADVYTSKSDKPLVKLSEENRETCILVLSVEGTTLNDFQAIPFSFHDDVYCYDQKVWHKLRMYSALLEKDEQSFRSERSAELNNYLISRKKLRNLNWYIKRMNLESARMLIAERQNKKAYNRMIMGYLADQALLRD